jgi:hypothetical protein
MVASIPAAANNFFHAPGKKRIPVLQTLCEGVPPLPLFFAKSNKHAGENEPACKNRVQNLDVKELTNQNLDNKGFRMPWFQLAALCRPRP